MDTPEFYPRFTHDCFACVFVGRYWDHHNREEQDVYLCGGGPGRSPDVIRRYGNEAHEYHSMDLNFHLGTHDMALLELCLHYVTYTILDPIDVAHQDAIWEDRERTTQPDLYEED